MSGVCQPLDVAANLWHPNSGVIMAFPGISYGPSAAPYIRIAELRAQREAATEQRYASRSAVGSPASQHGHAS